MAFREVTIPDAQRCLFARQPRSPRRRTAGAIAHRPTDAGPRPNELTARRIELRRRRPAARFDVVGDFRGKGIGTVSNLVIANEVDLLVSRGKRGHAIVSRWRQKPVRHWIARPPE